MNRDSAAAIATCDQVIFFGGRGILENGGGENGGRGKRGKGRTGEGENGEREKRGKGKTGEGEKCEKEEW